MKIFLDNKEQNEIDDVRKLLVEVPIECLSAVKNYVIGFSAGVEYERNRKCCNLEDK